MEAGRAGKAFFSSSWNKFKGDGMICSFSIRQVLWMHYFSCRLCVNCCMYFLSNCQEMVILSQFYVTIFLVSDVCWISNAVFPDMQVFCWFLLFFCKHFISVTWKLIKNYDLYRDCVNLIDCNLWLLVSKKCLDHTIVDGIKPRVFKI